MKKLYDELSFDVSKLTTGFTEALEGIKRLPKFSKFGVYLAYSYYFTLSKKIKKLLRMLLRINVYISQVRKKSC
jgi:15-cis-phytoene synthase